MPHCFSSNGASVDPIGAEHRAPPFAKQRDDHLSMALCAKNGSSYAETVRRMRPETHAALPECFDVP
jgi:hypothetical protein